MCDEDGEAPSRGGTAAQAQAPTWRVAAAYGWLSSELRFGDVTAPFDQRSVAVSLSRWAAAVERAACHRPVERPKS